MICQLGYVHLPPQKEMPTSPILKHMGMDIFRWPHSAALSPVHIAPENSTKEKGYEEEKKKKKVANNCKKYIC